MFGKFLDMPKKLRKLWFIYVRDTRFFCHIIIFLISLIWSSLHFFSGKYFSVRSRIWQTFILTPLPLLSNMPPPPPPPPLPPPPTTTLFLACTPTLPPTLTHRISVGAFFPRLLHPSPTPPAIMLVSVKIPKLCVVVSLLTCLLF